MNESVMSQLVTDETVKRKVLYLYCFTNNLAQPPPEAEGGGADALFLYRYGALTAVCGWTELAQWSGPQAESNMQDLQWLGPRVMRHQGVVEAVMRCSAVLPARLGTLFSSPAALERFCAINHGAIGSFLTATEAREEWAFKVLLDRAKASDWLVSRLANDQQATAAAPGSGTHYLQERRLRAAAAREINQWVARTLEPLVDELGRYASASRHRGVAAPAAAAQPHPLLNLAFLVRRESVADFRRCVERAGVEHQAAGLQLALSGPWPPYSFCPALEMPP